MLEAASTQGKALLAASTPGEIRSMVLRSVISHLGLAASSLQQLLVHGQYPHDEILVPA